MAFLPVDKTYQLIGANKLFENGRKHRNSILSFTVHSLEPNRSMQRVSTGNPAEINQHSLYQKCNGNKHLKISLSLAALTLFVPEPVRALVIMMSLFFSTGSACNNEELLRRLLPVCLKTGRSLCEPKKSLAFIK